MTGELRAFVTALAVVLPAGARAACPEPVPALSLADRLDDAEARFAEADAEGFHGAIDGALLAVPCLSEVLQPALAARLHRLHGLNLYVRGDAEGARIAFAAARAVAPGAALNRLLPEGHEARALFAGALTPGLTTRLDPPEDGTIWLDGIEGLDRPADRPVVIQVAVDGAVTGSVYALPGDAAPPYAPLRGGAPDPVASGPPEARTGRGGRVAWLVVAGAGAGTSAALYAMAQARANTFDGPLPADVYGPAELADLRRDANRLVIGAAVAGGVGAVGVVGFALGGR